MAVKYVWPPIRSECVLMRARSTDRCPPPLKYMMYGHSVLGVNVRGNIGRLRCMRRPRANNWVRSKRGKGGEGGGYVTYSRKIGGLWGVAHGCALTTETEVKTNECAA